MVPCSSTEPAPPSLANSDIINDCDTCKPKRKPADCPSSRNSYARLCRQPADRAGTLCPDRGHIQHQHGDGGFYSRKPGRRDDFLPGGRRGAGVCLYPDLYRLTRERGPAAAWQLASAVGNLVLLVLIVISALAALFAPQIVRYLLAPGFAGDPAKFELTVALMRLMLPSAVIFGVSGLIMGILNSQQVFLIPALTPSMYSLGMIFGVLVLSPSLGIFGLAWGVLIGAALHLGLQIPT
jgi:hypothetical protein